MMCWKKFLVISIGFYSSLVLATNAGETAAINSTAGIEVATTATPETGAMAGTASAAPIAAEIAKLPEEQIPLSIETTKKASEQNSSAAKAMMSMMIVLILLGAAYYYVRRYKTSNNINKSNTRIKVLSQHYLGPKKSLAIIHVAGESILVGITDQNISMIKSLSLIDDEVPADLPNSFGQTLNKAAGTEASATTRSAQKPAGATTQANSNTIQLEEEFSFANVTDTVSKKIKSMRSFS